MTTQTKEWTSTIADALASSRPRKKLTLALSDLASQRASIEAKIAKEIYSRAEGFRLLVACDECKADLEAALATVPANSK